MDQTDVVDVPDGRNPDVGLTLKNALRLRHASTLEFFCMLCCKKTQDKQRWLEAFAKERHRVREDKEMGELSGTAFTDCTNQLMCQICQIKGVQRVQ